jgi:hypothetical protein
MTRKSRPRSADEHVDRLLEDLPLNAEQRAFLANWRQGDQLDADHNPDEAQQVALELMRLAYRITDTDAGFDQWALHQLDNARLDWRLAFNETVLHRLADTPAQAIRHIEERDAEQSSLNSENARKDRPKAQDWWGQHIQDCLEGNFSASSDDVISYLLEAGKVEWDGEMLRHIENAADPISRAQVRSRMKAAKKRIERES